MKKLLIALLVGIPLVGCTEQTIIKKVPPPAAPAEETGETTDPTETGDGDPSNTTPPKGPTSSSTAPEDRCLDGQDMDADDIDITTCPALPSIPKEAMMGKEKVSLGAWEIGTTAEGETWKYGTFSGTGSTTRTLSYDGGETEVNAKNLECWAKGYYRLRKMLQDPPAEYVALYKAGFQYRFFQFQSDLRNGNTGFMELTSFQDHLVKWVTVVSKSGACEQPTLSKFKSYATSELKRRKIALPSGTN